MRTRLIVVVVLLLLGLIVLIAPASSETDGGLSYEIVSHELIAPMKPEMVEGVETGFHIISTIISAHGLEEPDMHIRVIDATNYREEVNACAKRFNNNLSDNWCGLMVYGDYIPQIGGKLMILGGEQTAFQWTMVVIHEFLHAIGFNSDACENCGLLEVMGFYYKGLITTIGGIGE